MATPYADRHVTLGGLLLGSYGIDCYDFDDLLRSPAKRGANRIIPGASGRVLRARQNDELRAALLVRIRGDFTQDNVPVTGMQQRVEQLYEHLRLVREVTEDTGTHTVELNDHGVILSGQCVVEDGGTPNMLNPYAANLVIDITVPDGALTIPAAS